MSWKQNKIQKNQCQQFIVNNQQVNGCVIVLKSLETRASIGLQEITKRRKKTG